MIDRREGHWDEATRNLERALELDPRNFFILQQLALAYGGSIATPTKSEPTIEHWRSCRAIRHTRINRALVALDWRADIKPFQATLATLVAENPSVCRSI